MTRQETFQNKVADEMLGGKWWLVKKPVDPQLFEREDLLGVFEADGAYFFEFVKDATPISLEFGDLVGWECFHNKVHVEDLFENEVTPNECLHFAIQAVTLVGERLQAKFPDVEFMVFASFDGDDAILNFHAIRPGEDYLLPDLNSYEGEAIIVLKLVMD